MSEQCSRARAMTIRAGCVLLVAGMVAGHAPFALAQGAPTGRKTAVDDHWVPTWGTLSNAFGSAPGLVGGAHMARRGTDSSEGYKAMADAIDLAIFNPKARK